MADKVHRLEDTQPSLTLGDVMVLLVGNDRAQEVLERMKRGIVRGMGNIAQEIVRSALQPVPASPVQPGRGPAILRQPTSTRLQGEIDELRGLGDAQRIQALQELVTREVDKLPQEHRAAFLANMYRQLAPTAEQTGSGLSVVRFDKPRGGRPRLQAHKSAIQRLRSGQDKIPNYYQWIQEYQQETGTDPAQTSSGATELYRKSVWQKYTGKN